MTEEQKYDFVESLVAGFCIHDAAIYADITYKEARNFMRRIEFKEYLRCELSNVYPSYKDIPKKWRDKL